MSSFLKFLILVQLSTIVGGTEDERDSWQNCEIFFAPSSLPTGGWGLFAGRDFEQSKVVEISPRYIPMPYDSPVVRNSVIDDYIYGYMKWNDDKKELEYLAGIVFGKVMFYNHHVEPNIKWISYGREPTTKEPTIAQATGFVALRNIEAGEELFSSYGTEDGGLQWFKNRRLEMVTIPTYASRKNGTIYEEDKKAYCSKVYAGIGRPSWDDRVMASVYEEKHKNLINTQRLADLDHPAAVVNQHVSAGTVLEIAPALVLSKDKVDNTALAPMSFFWGDWDAVHQQDLKELRDSMDLRVQHQSQATDWNREDSFREFEEVVLFPAGGNIALVERVGKSGNANCLIKIIASGSMKSHLNHGGTSGSAGILLQLVATKDLRTGDRLKLNIQATGSPYENKLLAETLFQTGQPVPDYLQDYLEPKMGDDEL